MENTKITLVISVVLIIAAAIGGYYYGSGVGYDKGIEVGQTATTTTVEEVVVNPLEDLPSTNPFEEIVKPFEEAYTNPFE